MTLAEMTEQEQVRCFQIQDDLTASRTMDEATASKYAGICIERARQYAEKVAAMKLPLYLTVWAKEMAVKTGKAMVKAHHNYLPWVEAFLVSRYGEAVEHWPSSLSERDLQRAREWKTKGLPTAFSV